MWRGVQEKYVKLQRDAEANVVLLLAVREQLTVRDGELAQSRQELAEQKGRCSSMEASMNAEIASRERTQRELGTANLQRDAVQAQLDRFALPLLCNAWQGHCHVVVPDVTHLVDHVRMCLYIYVCSETRGAVYMHGVTCKAQTEIPKMNATQLQQTSRAPPL